MVLNIITNVMLPYICYGAIGSFIPRCMVPFGSAQGRQLTMTT